MTRKSPSRDKICKFLSTTKDDIFSYTKVAELLNLPQGTVSNVFSNLAKANVLRSHGHGNYSRIVKDTAAGYGIACARVEKARTKNSSAKATGVQISYSVVLGGREHRATRKELEQLYSDLKSFFGGV